MTSTSKKASATEAALNSMRDKFLKAKVNTGEVSTSPKPVEEPAHQTLVPESKADSHQAIQTELQPAKEIASTKKAEPKATTLKPSKPAAKSVDKNAQPQQAIKPTESIQPVKPVTKPLKVTEPSHEENTELVLVDLGLLYDNPYNARTVYDPDVIKERAASISAAKQIVPIKVVPHPEEKGAYIIIDGHYRKRALQFLNAQKARVIIDSSPISSAQMYIQSFMSNNERTPQTAYDNAIAWNRLLKENVFSSYEELSNAIQVSKTNISKSLASLKLPEAALDIVKENPSKFSQRSLYELQKYYEQSQDEEFIQEMVKMLFDADISIDISQFIDRQSRKSDRKPRSSSRKHSLSLGNKEIGNMKDWGTGRLTLELKLEGDDREKFIKHMSSFMSVK